jgi:hypothetical protein
MSQLEVGSIRMRAGIDATIAKGIIKIRITRIKPE